MLKVGLPLSWVFGAGPLKAHRSSSESAWRVPSTMRVNQKIYRISNILPTQNKGNEPSANLRES